MITSALLVGLLAAPAAGVSEASLSVTVLVGRPDEGGRSQTSDMIAPGTVVYAGPGAWAFAGKDSTARAEKYLTLADRLKQTYRLASVSPEPARKLRLQVDQTEILPTVEAGPKVEITPLAIDPSTTTYRVRLRQGAALMAEPAVVVRRNGVAIFGARDGKDAPYLFVVLEDTTDPIKRLLREPKKIQNVAPVYPPEAKEARVEGLVLIKCRLDAEGRITQAEVAKGPPGEMGAKLNEAALEAVRQWRYEPALDETGHPTEIEMTLTISFRLASEASPKDPSD